MLVADDVLIFWLGPEPERDAPKEAVRARWWKKDPDFDREIEQTFGDAIASAGSGDLEPWAATPAGRLALIILLDQFTRNVFRGSGQMYAHDGRAVAHSLAALDAGEDQALRVAERYFLYMPLMHAEDIAWQERSVELFDQLAALSPWTEGAPKFARAHRDIVARFGRFPHRNDLLGRPTTEEEAEFLKQPGSSF